MHEADLAAVIARRSALHPFAATMGRYITGACRVLCDEYNGTARSVWDDLPATTGLVKRLRAFPGIGKHKAEVALFLLTREYEVAVRPDMPLDAALAHCARLGDLFGP
jgi:endonuclease III